MQAVTQPFTDAGHTKQQTRYFAPGERLSEKSRGENIREHRIGADGKNAKAGSYGLQPGKPKLT
jgi:hypothetical protein